MPAKWPHMPLLVLALLMAGALYACGGGSSGGETVDMYLLLKDFQRAIAVTGQRDMTGMRPNMGAGPDASTLRDPYGPPAVVDDTLYLPDTGNHRVLAYNPFSLLNTTVADVALGQQDFFSAAPGVSRINYGSPQAVAAYLDKLLVAEWANSRVLVYNTIPTSHTSVPSVVIGQPDFFTNRAACGDFGLNHPEGMYVAYERVIVADTANNRVLIWNAIPAVANTPADIVLGQPDMDTCARHAPSERTFDRPTGVWTNGFQLYVADTANNRVLVWKSWPATDFEPADAVLGQADFINTAANDDDRDGASDPAPTARTLNFPYGIYSSGYQLFVADMMNNRVLVWDGLPTSTFKPADNVLGQADFASTAANDDDQDGAADAAPSARTMNLPTSVYSYKEYLLVGDRGNNRYITFMGSF